MAGVLLAVRGKLNAECRMHCLIVVSFTYICLRLVFICWTGPIIQYNAVLNKQKLTTSNLE